jgi:hypothetical protein
VRPGEIFGHDQETDNWEPWYFRQALFTEDGEKMAGDVSRSENWYNVIQYPDILQTTADAIRQRQEDPSLDLDVSGEVTVSPSYHKMSARTSFSGDTDIEIAGDDRIYTGLRVRSGHSGMHGLKADVGGLREVCSNGMMGWVADSTFEQTHQEPFQPALIYQGVDSVIDGTDEIEQRLEDARSQKLGNRDELRLILHETVGPYLDNPTADVPLAMEEEFAVVSDEDELSLWNAYNAATRALTHYSDTELSELQLDHGYEQAAQLLETGYGLPNPDDLAEDTLENRAYELTEADDREEEEYWNGESEDLREMMQVRGLTS